MSRRAGGEAQDLGAGKRCSKCKATKPRAEFRKSSGAATGLGSQCKTCCQEYSARRKLRPEKFVTEKACSKCKATKPRAEFRKSSKAADGLGGQCKTCDGKVKRKYNYGLDTSDITGLYVTQSGRCGICCAPLLGRDCVDHNHTTGAVRGILCGTCNIRVGHVERLARDPMLTVNVADFLLPHEPDPSVRIVLEALKAAGEARAKAETQDQPEPRKPSRLALFRAA